MGSMKMKEKWAWVSIGATALVVTLTNPWYAIRESLIPNYLWLVMLVISLAISALALYKLCSVNAKEELAVRSERQSEFKKNRIWFIIVIFLPGIITSMGSDWFSSLLFPVNKSKLYFIIPIAVVIWLYAIFKLYRGSLFRNPER